MSTTRRDVIRQWIALTIGAAIVPSCIQDDKVKPAIKLKNLKLEGNEERLLAVISNTILPAAGTPSANDLQVPVFVVQMIDDLYPPDQQQQFLTGMKAFDKIADAKLNGPFTEAGKHEREDLIQGILNKQDKAIPESVEGFLKTMKKLTVQGYTSSRYYLTKVRVYELVPGRFYGCMAVQ